MAKKEIAGFVKLQIKGGQANPAPPVGPALGQRGVNIMEFCKAFNDKTKSLAGKPVPVEITVYKDKKFDFKIKSPPASFFIREAAKLKSGSQEPGRNIVASITKKQAEEIANKKHYGGLSTYRSSEGRTVRVKYRGKIKDTILNILGGIRSSCTYVGAPSLKQLSKCTTFVRVSNQFNETFTK